jgi:Na+/H+ antiporter NhaD/arsenite permease-like protein
MELLSQILALVIFVVMFIAIIADKWHRYIPALVGSVLTIVVVFLVVMREPAAVGHVLSLDQLFHGAFWVPAGEHLESTGVNWQTVIFIGGMMVMVEGLGEVGFFRWLCLRVAKMVNYRVVPILIAFMLLSGFLAMFIDSITVLLFLATVTVELARMLKFDPVPIIIAEIFASNVGGSATMSGDPPNIIIGTAYGYSFFDFAANTGPIAWIGMLVVLVFFYFAFRKVLRRSQEGAEVDTSTFPEPGEAITNRGLFRTNTVIFLLVVVLLVTHAQTGISVALIGVIAAALTLIAGFRHAGHVLRRVDWRTLVFFIGLFVTVGGLEETGVLVVLADFIADVSGGELLVVIPIILWISAVASAVVDNIPFAATMIPVLSNLARTAGFQLPTLAWTLALGADIGGNATPIGASANVVGTAVAQREGYSIGWGRFCRYTIPATIIVVALCWLYLSLRYA